MKRPIPRRSFASTCVAQTPILTAARRSGVRRVINLSSAAAYGTSAFRNRTLDEETVCDPASLYAITKFASEKVAARLAALWQCEIISVRLSSVFGPWERATGVRDTLSPQVQMLAALEQNREAILERPGVRDWIYAPDVAEAVTLLIEASKPKHQLYNISTGAEWPALQWGEELAALHPGFVCRLAQAGEVPTVDLHGPADRAPLSVARMAQEFGWRARFGCADSAADLNRLVDRASRGPDMRLQGRTAIVTGAGSGIGRASAVMFAKEGAFVALVDRDGAGLQETLAAVEGAKGEASMHVGDVGDVDFARAAVGEIVARRGRLDVLMTAAGISCGGTVLTTDPADWDAVFRTNVGGTWLWARAAVPEMQRQGSGSIITSRRNSRSPAAGTTAPISPPRARSSA